MTIHDLSETPTNGAGSASADAPHEPRARRPHPERDRPLRDATQAFQPSSPDDPRLNPESARRAVQAAVGSAYRVYEDYVRWGREAAAHRGPAAGFRETVRPRAPDPQAMAQWVQLWEELARTWMGYAAPFMPPPGVPDSSGFAAAPSMATPNGMNGARAARPFEAARGFTTPGPYDTASPPAAATQSWGELRVVLDTSRRVAVALHLTNRPAGPLTARLHREEGTEKLTLDLDASQIRIALPDTQPPGTYSGVIRDASGNLCGMLNLTVSQSSDAGA